MSTKNQHNDNRISNNMSSSNGSSGQGVSTPINQTSSSEAKIRVGLCKACFSMKGYIQLLFFLNLIWFQSGCFLPFQFQFPISSHSCVKVRGKIACSLISQQNRMMAHGYTALQEDGDAITNLRVYIVSFLATT